MSRNDRTLATQERTLRLAHEFLRETRLEIERAASEGGDFPPRIRSVTERPGHASPEYRTLLVPLPDTAAGASPTILSQSIARFAASRRPTCLLLALEVVGDGEGGGERPLLIAEARDRNGTRFFMIQPFERGERGIEWLEPIEGGWRDPGGEEMILDASFNG
jgi:hypothetical protein